MCAHACISVAMLMQCVGLCTFIVFVSVASGEHRQGLWRWVSQSLALGSANLLVIAP